MALPCTSSLSDIKGAGLRQVWCVCVRSCPLNRPPSHQSRRGKDVSCFNWLGIVLSGTGLCNNVRAVKPPRASLKGF